MKTTDDMDGRWKYSDAFRNVFLTQETEKETADGWSIVATRMRRRAIRRRIASCAAAMIPVALLIGIGLRHDTDTSITDTLRPTPVIADAYTPEIQNPDRPEIEGNIRSTVSYFHESSQGAGLEKTAKYETSEETKYETSEETKSESPGETKSESPGETKSEPPETVKVEIISKEEAGHSAADEFQFQENSPGEKVHRITLGLNTSVMHGMGSEFPVTNQTKLMCNAIGFGTENSEIVTQRNLSYEDAEFSHHTPIGTGLSISIGLNDRFYLETGINYTLLASDVLKSGSLISDEQRLHFIGIPVRLYWKAFEWNGCSVYAGLGGQAEKCIKATLGNETFSEKAIQWSVNAAAGLQYTLARNLSLYFQPEYSYHINGTGLRTIRTDDHTDLSLRCGLRFAL